MVRATIASVSAARWLVGTLAGVVLCFVLATSVAEHLESAIAVRANDMVANAMPSVQMLTNAGRDLRRLELEIDRYAAGSLDRRAELRTRIPAMRQNLDASLATYAALPSFPHEHELYEPIRESLARSYKLIDELLSRADATVLDSIHREFDSLDEAIQRVVAFDAAQGQRLGLEIQRIRGETRSIVVLLDVTSVALAIGAAYLALRQLRRATLAQKAEREALERRETELEAQNEALGQFAGRVAHDILSPLSSAMLALELVRHACERDADAGKAIERGIAAVTRVHTLVEGLLAFSRAGGHPEPGDSTEIAPVVADIIDGLSGQARDRRIELRVWATPEGEIACSKAVLISILSNLVRNAIKYMGDASERRIELRIMDAKERWRFEVKDTGPGIPAEHQQRIFQPYVQLGRGAQGIGLGLATVDRLVRAHAGSLGLISRPGHGCVFWFELPKPTAAGSRDAEWRAGAAQRTVGG